MGPPACRSTRHSAAGGWARCPGRLADCLPSPFSLARLRSGMWDRCGMRDHHQPSAWCSLAPACVAQKPNPVCQVPRWLCPGAVLGDVQIREQSTAAHGKPVWGAREATGGRQCRRQVGDFWLKGERQLASLDRAVGAIQWRPWVAWPAGSSSEHVLPSCRWVLPPSPFPAPINRNQT